MTISGDIVLTWRQPRAVIRRKLASGPREDRALAVLMAAVMLLFLAQWPQAMRAAQLDASIPLEARLAGALMGAVFLLPLAAYGVAGISHLIGRSWGGKGTGYGARLALFWALLAVTPLMLVQGLVAGWAGPGAALTLLQAGIAGFFLWLWLSMLIEAER